MLIIICRWDVFFADRALLVRVEVLVVFLHLRAWHGLVADRAEEDVAGAMHRVHPVVGHRDVPLAKKRAERKRIT